jgi:hypothetical protein
LKDLSTSRMLAERLCIVQVSGNLCHAWSHSV